MGQYSFVNLIGLLVQSLFIDNILLAFFLGMCTFLSCSNKVKTANGLGIAVVGVMTISGILNWTVTEYVLAPGALGWLSHFGIDASQIDLSFLTFILYISIIAGFVQVLEIAMEKFTPRLYTTLGIFLPLISVNCAILGGCLIALPREYPFLPQVTYMFGSGAGWWLAIVLIAAMREKMEYSNVVAGLRGNGITFVASGLMAMAFMGLAGTKVVQVTSHHPSVYSIQYVAAPTPPPSEK